MTETKLRLSKSRVSAKVRSVHSARPLSSARPDSAPGSTRTARSRPKGRELASVATANQCLQGMLRIKAEQVTPRPRW
jgi:hypothetical protein